MQVFVSLFPRNFGGLVFCCIKADIFKYNEVTNTHIYSERAGSEEDD